MSRVQEVSAGSAPAPPESPRDTGLGVWLLPSVAQGRKAVAGDRDQSFVSFTAAKRCSEQERPGTRSCSQQVRGIGLGPRPRGIAPQKRRAAVGTGPAGSAASPAPRGRTATQTQTMAIERNVKFTASQVA